MDEKPYKQRGIDEMEPLEGIKVLDLSSMAQGRYCTMLLRDFGADVVILDQPSNIALNTLKRSEPPWSLNRMLSLYQAFDRGKKNIVLDLKHAEAYDVFLRISQEADIIVETFRPGVAKRLGVDYETVKKKNPKVIYCSITSYGQEGPYKDIPAHDINCIAVAGALNSIGDRGGPPVPPLNLLGLFAGGGLQGAIGILTALIAREKTGKGQYIDISMTDGVISVMSMHIYDYFTTGEEYKRGETIFGGSMAYDSVYECKDKKLIAIGCVEDRFWERLCRELGKEALIPVQYAESKEQDEMKAQLSEIFQTQSQDYWFNLLAGKGIPISKVNAIPEVSKDPQVVYRHMFTEVNHPLLNKVKQVGVAIKLSDTPGSVKDPVPLVGQHTREVLQEIAYSDTQIERLGKIGAAYIGDASRK